MGGRHFTKTTVILFLVFLGSLFLETKLKQHPFLELFVLIVGILVSIIALYAIRTNKSWAWPLTTLLYAALLINLLVLFSKTGEMLVFSIAGIFNLFGLLISIGSLKTKDENPEIDPYEVVETYKPEPDMVEEPDAKKVESVVFYGNKKVKKAKKVASQKTKNKTKRKKNR